MPIKPGRGGAVTRPQILPVQNLSPQGENWFIPLREIRKTAFFGGRVDAPPLQEDNTKNDTIDISTILPYCDHDRFLPTPVPGAFRKRWILPRPKNMPPACFLNGLSNPAHHQQKGSTPLGWIFFGDGEAGFERPLRKHAGGMFLGRSRIHGLMNAPGTGVGIRPS